MTHSRATSAGADAAEAPATLPLFPDIAPSDLAQQMAEVLEPSLGGLAGLGPNRRAPLIISATRY